MIENQGRRVGLRLRKIKELELLDLRLSPQCVDRDVREAVGSQKPEVNTEVSNGYPMGEAQCLPLGLPSDWPFILALKQ